MSDLKKVLIIRFSSIGDIVLCSPIIRCIKNQTGADIHFITKKSNQSIVMYDPNITKVWIIKDSIKEVISGLKSENFDLIIDLHKNIRSKLLIAALYCKAITFNKVNWRKWLFVHLKIDLLPNIHLVDRYFESLKDIGIQNDGAGLSFYLSKEDEKYVIENKLKNKKVIVLGANYVTKRVPIHLVSALLSLNQKEYILLGGKDVANIATEIKEKFPDVINLVGKITLQESASVIKHAKQVITGDTGLMHIAAAFKKDIVVVWGSTNHRLGMFPYFGAQEKKYIPIRNQAINCNPCSKIGKDKCPKGHMKCLNEIDKDEFLQSVGSII